MRPDTLTLGVAFIVLAVAFTSFWLGIKADMWCVKKAARLSIPYVAGDAVYMVIPRAEWDAAVKAANLGIAEMHKQDAKP